MRKVAEKSEGTMRGFKVTYPDIYVLECEEDNRRQIKCLACKRLTVIAQAKRSPYKTGVGDIVAADIDELWCDCGRHLGTMDNNGNCNGYGGPMIILDKQAKLIE